LEREGTGMTSPPRLSTLLRYGAKKGAMIATLVPERKGNEGEMEIENNKCQSRK